MDQALYIPGSLWHGQSRGPEGWGTWLHDPLHQSITEIHEGPFIAKILNDLHYRSNLFNIKNLYAEGALIKAGVELRELRKNLIGDIDILIVPHGKPERSTAMQVKRFPLMVKVHEDDDPDPPEVKEGKRLQRIGRMRRLFQEGIEQANYAAQVVGFSQVYLLAFVLADTRWVNGGRYTYEGPDSSRRSEVDYALSPMGLDARVGFMQYQWGQPMDRPPLELATYGGSFRRLATTTTQPPQLTEWLRTLRPSAKDLSIGWPD